MIQFITHETGPSQRTLEKIAFINKLNEGGLNATLYGFSHWPKGKCQYKTLHNFKIEKNSIIIVDGIKIESSFDLVNIARYTYTHGRKNRVLSYILFIKKYLLHLLSLKFNYKLICYVPHKFQNDFSIFSFTISDHLEKSHLNLANLVNNSSSLEFQKKLYIISDISEANKIAETISNSHLNEIVLAGAIIEPLYFKEKIIPLMNEQKKKISIIGFQENMSFAQLERTKPSSEKEASLTINYWNSLFLKLKK